MNKYELQSQAKDSLKEAIEWVMQASGEVPTVDDLDLHDLIDGLVPVYTSDLLDLAKSDFGEFGWINQDIPLSECDSIDKIVMYNVSDFLYEYMTEVFDEVLAGCQEPITLLMTDDPRIVTQGKNAQFCPEERIDEFYVEYIEGTGEQISEDDWLDCFEEASLDELDTATADQIFGLEQNEHGNWVVI